MPPTLQGEAGLISGQITYELVPVQVDAHAGAWLDYAATQVKPVRHVMVEAVSASGQVLGTGITDENGRYALRAPPDTVLVLRIKSQVHRSALGVSWRYAVRDNTTPGFAKGGDAAAVYQLQSQRFSSGQQRRVVHLHAASGWTGQRYGAARAAAPFAILDQIDAAANMLAGVDPGTTLPSLNVFWSVRNQPTPGDPAVGNIGEAHYQAGGAAPGLYLSGREDVDTDEYDRSVLLHEYGHYVMTELSRTDIVGGSHPIDAVLEPGFALSEAWANAFSSMVRGSADHQDTMGVGQGEGWHLALVKLQPGMARGWYSEVALGYLLHQLHGAVGLKPLLQTLLQRRHLNPAWSSIYAFATPLRARLDAIGQQRLDALLDEIGVVSGSDLDLWGSRESRIDAALLNRPAEASAVRALLFPLNPPLSQRAVTLCLGTRFGSANKQGNVRFGHFAAAQAGERQLELVPVNAAARALLHQVAVSLRHANGDLYEIPAATRRGGFFWFEVQQPGVYNLLLEIKSPALAVPDPACFAVRLITTR
ncbi:hypothetical protein JCM19000A_23890 [Silvimonas sp. JCM 19000]